MVRAPTSNPKGGYKKKVCKAARYAYVVISFKRLTTLKSGRNRVAILELRVYAYYFDYFIMTLTTSIIKCNLP